MGRLRKALELAPTFRRPYTDTNYDTYFIQGVDGGPIKIGRSVDPLSRLSSLQTGSPVVLKMLATVPGELLPEEALHKAFADLRTHGEWFSADPQLLSLIESLPDLKRAHEEEKFERAQKIRLKQKRLHIEEARNIIVNPLLTRYKAPTVPDKVTWYPPGTGRRGVAWSIGRRGRQVNFGWEEAVLTSLTGRLEILLWLLTWDSARGVATLPRLGRDARQLLEAANSVASEIAVDVAEWDYHHGFHHMVTAVHPFTYTVPWDLILTSSTQVQEWLENTLIFCLSQFHRVVFHVYDPDDFRITAENAEITFGELCPSHIAAKWQAFNSESSSWKKRLVDNVRKPRQKEEP